MTLEQFFLLFLFVTALVGTPGPANMSLLASGMAHGAINTLPFLVGTMTGFQAILALNAIGLFALISAIPGLLGVLKVLCIGYICYLAYGIATSAPKTAVRSPARGRIVGDIVKGFWIHPLNPKAYAMQISALTQFVSPDDNGIQFAIVALTFMIWGGLLNFVWSASGALFNRFADTPSRFRALTCTLAALMIVSVFSSLFFVST
ncbi:MAG: LysE family translocator [Fimbriimonadaceae bacterium]|nr:LysE family translocator [Alphaproteobacteria bacterium]